LKSRVIEETQENSSLFIIIISQGLILLPHLRKKKVILGVVDPEFFLLGSSR
jgi:hypothetical protein